MRPHSSFQLRTKTGNLCVDTRFKGQGERFNLETCIRDNKAAGGEQVGHVYTKSVSQNCIENLW